MKFVNGSLRERVPPRAASPWYGEATNGAPAEKYFVASQPMTLSTAGETGTIRKSTLDCVTYVNLGSSKCPTKAGEVKR